MKRSATLVSTFLIAGSAAAADFSAIPSGTYNLDPTHAYVNFQYNHLGLSNPVLQFDEFDMSMNLDVEDPTKTTMEFQVAVDSIEAGSDIWREHLTGDKWFDTANNPTINFKSTEVAANGDGTYNVTGDLTIKGITKTAAVQVTINGAMEHPRSKKPVVGLSAVGGVKRSEWDMGAAVPFVSDEVKIEIQAEMYVAE